jgi:hypothetical protein
MSETTNKPANPVPSQTPLPLNTSIAACGVWLVKVPNYLAKKWNEAPSNSDVGVIRITQSKFGLVSFVKRSLDFDLFYFAKKIYEQVKARSRFSSKRAIIQVE